MGLFAGRLSFDEFAAWVAPQGKPSTALRHPQATPGIQPGRVMSGVPVRVDLNV